MIPGPVSAGVRVPKVSFRQSRCSTITARQLTAWHVRVGLAAMEPRSTPRPAPVNVRVLKGFSYRAKDACRSVRRDTARLTTRAALLRIGAVIACRRELETSRFRRLLSSARMGNSVTVVKTCVLRDVCPEEPVTLVFTLTT